MNKFISVIKNIFSIEPLRRRIINTLYFILIFRIGSFIVLPGIDPAKLSDNQGGILGLLDTFVGGAFSNASIFALGIMPYISASIVLQLLTITIPYFQRMQKEGDSGRKKITQYTRILTVFITVVQASSYIAVSIPREAIVMDNKILFSLSCIVILVAGTIFCMWLGEKITEKGIGNGISMLIMIGIVSRFPTAILLEAYSRGMGQMLVFILELCFLFFVIIMVVMLIQGVRRIPIQYAKQVGSRVQGVQRQYLPLKVNSAGVMPIIFAQSLMFVPSLVASFFTEQNDVVSYIVTSFSDYRSWQYNLVFAILIIIFTFFYTAITVDPNQIVDDMKRNSGFIPGVKPGKDTAEFIDNILSKITLPGALFLALIAILPSFVGIAGVKSEFSQFFGGTSLLIMVGVILETLQQIESYLLMMHYEGIMKTGKFKERFYANDSI